jgi:hypothetical protein
MSVSAVEIIDRRSRATTNLIVSFADTEAILENPIMEK